MQVAGAQGPEATTEQPSKATELAEMPTQENKDTVVAERNENQPTDVEPDDHGAGSHLPPDLDIKHVRRFFGVLFLANFCVNLDIGVLPATTIAFQKELKLTTAELGALGSVVYVGQAVGCVCASVALQKMNENRVMPLGLLLNMLALLWFTQLSLFYSLMISRGLTGLFQQIVNIYFPVWTDAFASESKKATWLSIIMVGATTGNIAGYVLAAVLQDYIGWRGVFYIQIGAICLVILACLATPGAYINLR